MRRVPITVALTALLAVAPGCEEPAGKLPSRPVEVQDRDDITSLENVGLRVYHGETPPDITGRFACDSLVIVYDDFGMQFDIVDDYVWEFYDQQADGMISVDYEAPSVEDVATGLKGTIEGEGDCYSVLIQQSGQIPDCDYISLTIYSGCKEADGLRGWQSGFIMSEKEGTGCNVLMAEGHRRIIEEEDGIASLLP